MFKRNGFEIKKSMINLRKKFQLSQDYFYKNTNVNIENDCSDDHNFEQN